MNLIESRLTEEVGLETPADPRVNDSLYSIIRSVRQVRESPTRVGKNIRIGMKQET